jgi:hypothetical protein
MSLADEIRARRIIADEIATGKALEEHRNGNQR